VSGSPEDLLRGALEKIVFFECRVEQLESELRASRAMAARAREESAEARRRESELESRLLSARGEAEARGREAGELAERARMLEEERGRFLSGLVERARLQGAPSEEGSAPGDEADLAGFIAELRAEIDTLSRWKTAAIAAGVQLPGEPGRTLAEAAAPRPAESLPAMAARFAESGRSRLGAAEPASLAPAFSTRTERTLYLSSLDDLSSPDPTARRRAAACLKALGSRASAPVLAAALGREPDGEAKAAILGALGALGEPSVADLVGRELGDVRPAVRAAAVDAVAALLGAKALPALSAALGDESPAVRRRAAVQLGFLSGDGAEEALAAALADRDAGVARAAAVALSGRPTARAQGVLARALDHRELSVRRAAARAVERWSGERVEADGDGAERRRASRRIAERLHALGRAELRGAVAAAAAGTTPTATPTRTVPTPTRTSTRTPPSPTATAPRAAVAVALADPSLDDAVLAEVRTALRGRTAAEISQALGREPPQVEAALRALVTRGRLSPRGPRFFMA